MVAAVLAGAAAAFPMAAKAATMEELSAAAEETSEAYDAAVAERDRIQGEIDALQEQISAKENELPGYQEKANSAAVTLYKIGNERSVLIEMLLDSDSLESAIETWSTYEKMMGYYSNCISANNTVRDSLNADKAKLEEDRAAAQVAVEETGSAMEAAKAARQEAQEAAQAKAQSADDAALAAEIDWNMSKEEFIANWAPRVDAYLAGSPLEGYGQNFAEAAWNTGADVRFSPAISCIESGKGQICFRPHNAWGWMGHSFDSWEDAIPQHVSYLCSSIYGTNGYLTRSFASTYCPPTADSWYNKVKAEMRKI